MNYYPKAIKVISTVTSKEDMARLLSVIAQDRPSALVRGFEIMQSAQDSPETAKPSESV